MSRQSKGHHVPTYCYWVMWFLTFKPRTRNCYKRLQHNPFLWCWLANHDATDHEMAVALHCPIGLGAALMVDIV